MRPAGNGLIPARDLVAGRLQGLLDHLFPVRIPISCQGAWALHLGVGQRPLSYQRIDAKHSLGT